MEHADKNTDLFPIAVLRSIPTIGRKSTFDIWRQLRGRELSWQVVAGNLARFVRNGVIDKKQKTAINNEYTEQEKKLRSAFAQLRDVRLVGFSDDEYPPLLRHSDSAPAFLYARGPIIDWKDAMVVAVVGARNMTEYGKMVTEKIAHELAEAGVIVVSGLMYGVDTTAHFAALEVHGQTAAVLGYGFNHCYPEEHRKELGRFLQLGGTMYTEYAPWIPPIAGQFPARNTIVAGMSEGIVVTEAAEESGTMITVQAGIDNGRHIFAVPGPIDNPYTAGTRQLINEGATLIASGADVIFEL